MCRVPDIKAIFHVYTQSQVLSDTFIFKNNVKHLTELVFVIVGQFAVVIHCVIPVTLNNTILTILQNSEYPGNFCVNTGGSSCFHSLSLFSGETRISHIKKNGNLLSNKQKSSKMCGIPWYLANVYQYIKYVTVYV